MTLGHLLHYCEPNKEYGIHEQYDFLNFYNTIQQGITYVGYMQYLLNQILYNRWIG